MTNRNRQPRLYPQVMKAVGDLQTARGTTMEKIINQVRLTVLNSRITPKPRNVVMHVRQALKHGVDSGTIRHQAGKYKLMPAKKRPQRISSVESDICNVCGMRRRRKPAQRRRKRRTSKPRRQRTSSSEMSGSDPRDTPVSKKRSCSADTADFEEKASSHKSSEPPNPDKDLKTGRPESKNSKLDRRNGKGVDGKKRKPPCSSYDEVMNNRERSQVHNVRRRKRARRSPRLPQYSHRPPTPQMDCMDFGPYGMDNKNGYGEPKSPENMQEKENSPQSVSSSSLIHDQQDPNDHNNPYTN